MKILSWNIQGFKTNYIWLQQLAESYDIILIQESWLFSFESELVEKLFAQFKCVCVTSMPSHKNSCRGRPYGGTIIMLKRDYESAIKVINTSDPRLPYVILETNLGSMLIANMYMPCNTNENSFIVSEYVGKLEAICNDHDGLAVLMGDYNLSPQVTKYQELSSMCEDNKLVIVDVKQLPKCTTTFTSKGSGSSSWIDHCIVSDSLLGTASVPYGAGPSDHLPLLFEADIMPIKASRTPPPRRPPNVKWAKLSDTQKLRFRNDIYHMISQEEWHLCEDLGCDNSEHCEIISQKTELLINILQQSANNFTKVPCKRKVKNKCIHGWNALVKPYYENYRDSFLNWRACKNESMFREMCEKRKSFRKALVRCRRDKQKRESDELASSYDGKNFVEFWEKIKRHDNQKESLAAHIDGVDGAVHIAEHWAKVYEKLFNTPQSTIHESYVQQYIQKGKFSPLVIEVDAVFEAVRKLKTGKCAGSEGIQAEHYKHCIGEIVPLLTTLFRSMLAHGHVPSVIMTVVIVPIVKRVGLDGCLSSNYRPIAIASVLSKILELVIMKYTSKYLGTSDNQFGFKRGVGTEIAIYGVKQIAHHYMRNGTPVYACYMDASKAFDLVNHFTLLRKLCKRGVQPSIIRLLLFWFRNQTFQVRWGQTFSRHFSVLTSVRQGSVTSPYYFAVYLDKLSKLLTKSDVGCRIGDIVINHFCFADDVVLLTTSIVALKVLLKICEKYAKEHDLTFNPTKTVCQVFCDHGFDSTMPLIKLCGKTLQWKETVRYLGFDINCHRRDEEELVRRKRELYARANLIRNRFSSCSLSVKKFLFKTFFSNIYCASVWVPLKKNLFQHIKVAYNDACRIVFEKSRRNSASAMFCELTLCDFNSVRRLAAFSLLRRIATSNNIIIKAIINSNVFIKSSISKEWKKILFNIGEGSSQ